MTRSTARRAKGVDLLLVGDGLKIKTFSCYHRFFSQARWTVDAVGRVVLGMVLKFIPEDAPIVVAVDDTLNRKTGKRIWAAGMHHDPLLSTARRAVFSFGHNWVVLSIQLRLPFAPEKIWSLPILMRLYRSKQKKDKPVTPGRPPTDSGPRPRSWAPTSNRPWSISTNTPDSHTVRSRN